VSSSSLAPARLVARTEPIDPPVDLLDELGPEGFAWLAPDASFVTSGVVASLAPEEAAAWLRAVAHVRDASVPFDVGPRACGALPFGGRGRLVVPESLVIQDADGAFWRTTIAADDAPSMRLVPTQPTRFAVSAATSRDDWCESVREALDAINAGHLTKVVLARAVDVTADEPFDPRAVLRQLVRTQPGCITFAADGFVGATPELLVRKHGADVMSRPLAGTGTDVDALKESTKDGHEHQLVVDAVARALGSLSHDLNIDGPRAIAFADVAHLATTISASVDADISVIDLVDRLHPTPAVGGTPSRAAVEFIARHERDGRGRYAGPCGWTNADGDGEFVVALRCAQLDGVTARLHAGAGIVAGSDPDSEWAETQQKFEPMLRALVRP
jgi:menaquinone-specific isochorismate synthase